MSIAASLRSKYTNIKKDKDFFEIIKGSIWSFGAKILTVLFGLLLNLLITRYYGAESMGFFSIINSFFSFTLIFSLLGTNTSILRLIPEYKNKYSFYYAKKIYFKLIYLVLLISFIISLISYLNADILAIKIFNNENLIFFISIASFFIIPQALSTLNNSALRAFGAIKLFAFMQVANQFSKIIILLILTIVSIKQYNPIYTIFYSYCITMLLSIIFIIYIFNKVDTTIIKEPSKGLSYFTILNLSMPMFLTAGMQMVMSQADIIMLSAMSTLENVGVYTVVMKLSLLTSFILSTINTMAAPKFSELYYTKQMEALKNIAQKSTKMMFWSSLPIVIFFILFGTWILNIFGSEFVIGYITLLTLILGQFINAISGSVGYFLNMTGYQKQLNIIVLISVILNIILNYFMIPLYNIEGAAIASAISLIFWNITASIYIKKQFGFYIGYIPLLKKGI